MYLFLSNYFPRRNVQIILSSSFAMGSMFAFKDRICLRLHLSSSLRHLKRTRIKRSSFHGHFSQHANAFSVFALFRMKMIFRPIFLPSSKPIQTIMILNKTIYIFFSKKWLEVECWMLDYVIFCGNVMCVLQSYVWKWKIIPFRKWRICLN